MNKPTEKKTIRTSIRFTETEFRKIEKAAKSERLTITDYIREQILEDREISCLNSSDQLVQNKLDSIISGLIEMHKMNALAVGRQLYGVPDNIKDHLLKYREEQIQSLISVLKDEGRSLV